MKLKRYLTEFQNTEDHEGSRVKKLNNWNARDILQTKCKKALDDYMRGIYIQRYDRHAPSVDFGFLDASKMPSRLSRNTLNYYSLIINSDPSWKQFPRRQVICSLRRKKNPPVPNNGEFIIFPYDGVKIGNCSRQDMWDSWSILSNFGISAHRFNEFIKKMLNFGNHNATMNHDHNIKEFKKACKLTDKWIANTKGGVKTIGEVVFPDMNRSLRTMEYYEFSNKNFYKMIVDIYNPSNFKVSTPGTQRGSEMNEVWFEGPALFINASSVTGFIDRLRIGQEND